MTAPTTLVSPTLSLLRRYNGSAWQFSLAVEVT